jgi:hypothetical protein
VEVAEKFVLGILGWRERVREALKAANHNMGKTERKSCTIRNVRNKDMQNLVALMR